MATWRVLPGPAIYAWLYASRIWQMKVVWQYFPQQILPSGWGSTEKMTTSGSRNPCSCQGLCSSDYQSFTYMQIISFFRMIETVKLVRSLFPEQLTAWHDGRWSPYCQVSVPSGLLIIIIGVWAVMNSLCAAGRTCGQPILNMLMVLFAEAG